MPKPLILISCTATKRIIPSDETSVQPIPGIEAMREELLYSVRTNSQLASYQANRQGVLSPDSPLTKAYHLYNGKFYQNCSKILADVANHKNNHTEILIVSAMFGLLQLGESIPEYNLTMGEKLNDKLKVFQFWQRANLWRVLQRYIEENGITHLWSFLPHSNGLEYHQVFEPLWNNAKHLNLAVYHLKANKENGSSYGQGTTVKRAEWLNMVMQKNPGFLIMDKPPIEYPSIPNTRFSYR